MNKLAIITGAALLSTSIIGLAGEAPLAPANLNSYAYVGVEGGVSKMYFDHDQLSPSIDEKHDGWDISGRFLVGYAWQVATKVYLGIEAGYSAYAGSEFKGTTPDGRSGFINIKGYQVDLLGVVQYNFTNHFNAFVKAGAAYVWQTFDANGSLTLADIGLTVPIEGNQTRGDNAAGKAVVGLGYDFTNTFGITLSYSQLFGTDSPDELNDIISTGSVYLGIVYRFV